MTQRKTKQPRWKTVTKVIAGGAAGAVVGTAVGAILGYLNHSHS